MALQTYQNMDLASRISLYFEPDCNNSVFYKVEIRIEANLPGVVTLMSNLLVNARINYDFHAESNGMAVISIRVPKLLQSQFFADFGKAIEDYCEEEGLLISKSEYSPTWLVWPAPALTGIHEEGSILYPSQEAHSPSGEGS